MTMTNQEFIESIRLEGEEWRDVVGYEGYYMVSSYGRIASMIRHVERKHRTGSDSNYTTKPRLCKISIHNNSPYHRYTLYVGKPDRRLVHRIVAEAFIPNPNNYPEVDHINDNPSDNRACNLQWVTPKMNSSKFHHRNALSIANKGNIPPNRKPVVKLDMNGQYAKTYPSMSDAEKEGFSHSAIHNVIHGNRKSHGGYKWMYLSEWETLINQEAKELSPMQ